MARFSRNCFLHATAITHHAVRASILITLGTTAFLSWRYPTLPTILPVHFNRNGVPNGWQFKTPPRVLMPVLVQVSLLVTLGAIGWLLLSRRDARSAGRAADVRAAHTACEAVMLIASIWVGFQAYAAVALAALWAGAPPTL